MSEVVATETKPAKKAQAQKYRVTIHSGEDKGDKGDVVLAHNFRQIQIQRDKEVVIEEHFVNVLRHSTIETMVKGEDGKVQLVRIPRFSFSAEPA
jgi:hypothetical protein